MLARCQRDAYLRSLDTAVIDCEADGENGVWIAHVADTVLYPEGGGQPADLGRVAGVRVLDVQRDASGFAVTLEKPVDPGEASMTVDWARRYDHMQQHTAQHLITAVAHDRHDWPTVGFHLGSETCTIDLDADPDAVEQSLAALEDAVNAEIRRDRTVSVQIVDEDAYAELDDVRSRGLPDDHEGPVRLIEIEGIDRNTCGGTHVASLAELQTIVLVDVESVRGGARLHYLAGDRVRSALHAGLERESNLNQLLSTGPEAHADAVQRLLDERRSTRQQSRRLSEELAGLLGSDLAGRLADTGQRVAALHRDDADMGFLRRVASAVHEREEDAIVLLTAAPSGEQAGVFLLAGPNEFVATHGPVVAETLGGRGGGAGGRYQGKMARSDARDDAVHRLRAALDG